MGDDLLAELRGVVKQFRKQEAEGLAAHMKDLRELLVEMGAHGFYLEEAPDWMVEVAVQYLDTWEVLQEERDRLRKEQDGLDEIVPVTRGSDCYLGRRLSSHLS